MREFKMNSRFFSFSMRFLLSRRIKDYVLEIIFGQMIKFSIPKRMLFHFLYFSQKVIRHKEGNYEQNNSGGEKIENKRQLPTRC